MWFRVYQIYAVSCCSRYQLFHYHLPTLNHAGERTSKQTNERPDGSFGEREGGLLLGVRIAARLTGWLACSVAAAPPLQQRN